MLGTHRAGGAFPEQPEGLVCPARESCGIRPKESGSDCDKPGSKHAVTLFNVREGLGTSDGMMHTAYQSRAIMALQVAPELFGKQEHPLQRFRRKFRIAHIILAFLVALAAGPVLSGPACTPAWFDTDPDPIGVAGVAQETLRCDLELDDPDEDRHGQELAFWPSPPGRSSLAPGWPVSQGVSPRWHGAHWATGPPAA